ncbi:unnamed protein product [Orchesella dallaii]|uniref:Uncharacterized protein n=1 Tax=Orchesella dallaii TaxID=48710 RepID=A0ABP1RU84_9HEXA
MFEPMPRPSCYGQCVDYSHTYQALPKSPEVDFIRYYNFSTCFREPHGLVALQALGPKPTGKFEDMAHVQTSYKEHKVSGENLRKIFDEDLELEDLKNSYLFLLPKVGYITEDSVTNFSVDCMHAIVTKFEYLSVTLTLSVLSN